MRINITARRFKLSEDVKDFAETEVQRLKKYHQDILDVEIILSWERNDRIAEINLAVLGNKLTAHELSEDMKKSIVLSVDKLERQIRKFKDKKQSFEHKKINAAMKEVEA